MEKLRPEQRKLWRRTFLSRQEQGDDAETAAMRADDAVSAWEARGAFEEDMPAERQREIVPHWHARIRVVATVEGAAIVMSGDRIHYGDGRLAVITTNAAARGGALDFDVMGEDVRPDVGAKIRLSLPRLGVAAEGIVIA